MHSIPFFYASTIERLLSMDRCIDMMKDAMIAATEKAIVAPPRLIVPLHDESGLFALMPGSARTPAIFGAKIISLLPANPHKGRPAIQGFVCLFDHETGAPIAFLEGSAITAIRTAGVSGLATRLLARADVETHGIFGTGVQARAHAASIKAARPSIAHTLVWGRSFKKARAVAADISAQLGIHAEAVAEPQAVAACDVISTVTASPTPVIEGGWIRSGAHMNLVGAHSKSTREADTETILRSKNYVDLYESAQNEAGELLMPIEEGAFSMDQVVGEIGALAQGKIEGRGSDEDITCYHSVGVFAQDLYAAHAVLEVANFSGASAPLAP